MKKASSRVEADSEQEQMTMFGFEPPEPLPDIPADMLPLRLRLLDEMDKHQIARKFLIFAKRDGFSGIYLVNETNLVARVFYKKKVSYIEVPKRSVKGPMNRKKVKGIYYRFDLVQRVLDADAAQLILDALEFEISQIPSELSCCSSCEKCSDLRSCLHQDEVFYLGCHYKRNLLAGRIFYGKNKNISDAASEAAPMLLLAQQPS